MREEILEAVHRVLDSQHFILGPEVGAFEEEAARYLEVPHALGCASGTDALLLSLMALRVGPGDADYHPLHLLRHHQLHHPAGGHAGVRGRGARQLQPEDGPDPGGPHPRTKAVIPVHLFGQMCRLEEIALTLEERGVALVEDCAQSFGSLRRVGDRILRAGSVGDLSCFSFFPTKNLGAYGDAGMVASRREDLAGRVRNLRVHGAATTYFHDEGLNSRLDALQAAVLLGAAAARGGLERGAAHRGGSVPAPPGPPGPAGPG